MKKLTDNVKKGTGHSATRRGLTMLMAALSVSAIFADVPEVKWGRVTVKEGQKVSAEEAKLARAALDSDSRASAERATLIFKKSDQATIAAVVAAFPEASAVEARYCKIDDISVFATLANLKDADFYGSTVNDFAPLAACKRLVKLGYYAVKAPQTVYDSLAAIKSLKELTGGLSGVESVAFVKDLPQLEYFSVFAESVGDLESIGGAAGLKHVKLWNLDGRPLSGRKIPEAGDLKFLASCTKLEKIELPGSAYTGLESLAGLTSVKYLDLSAAANDIDLSFTKGYGKLTFVTTRLARGKVSGLEALAGKPLDKVDLDGDFDVDLSFLKGLDKLKTLSISAPSPKKTRNVANFKAIANLPALVSLTAIGSDGIDFDTIKSLAKLSSLAVSKGALTEAQVAELKAAKPKLRITER
jgi:hypothetical protein